MKRSVIGADFEKKDAVPPYSESKQKMKLKRRVSLDHISQVVRVAPCIKVTSLSCSGGEGEDHRRWLVQYESP